ncbi:hypothetical protein [Thalassomonas actiniarum]|uniref:DUF5625 domain-containing protein n=1 Tax=Thalassomonas actiniarum TaxID=485447 RepID=A0AAE9YT87_9GAMM|nr:hypothetical protein [Thalassomonas actiniarum]WDD99077.1 hypothetical protein SG35_028320 [Thalassomonas actiniarum]
MMKNNNWLLPLLVSGLALLLSVSARAGSCCAAAPLVLEHELFADIEQAAEPIYIDGVLYQLTKSDFTPIYISHYIQAGRERIRVERLVAYTLTIPVYGDIGQELIFDINGRSDGYAMDLSVSCGTFSAGDSGDKYVISSRMTTEQSCTSMRLSFAVSGSAPSFIDLSILIAEAF